MLVANLDEKRIEAREAEKGPKYYCPECKDIVVLKKGPIVTHHFAHKPPVNCGWAEGETRKHLEAKRLFQEEFTRRGLRTEVEQVVPSLPGDRRADVMVWSPEGQRFALELQHCSISYGNLEHRTQSYVSSGVRVIWIPFFRPDLWKEAKVLGPDADGDFLIERFPARPLEKWVHGFYFGELWMYDPNSKVLWKAKLSKHLLHVEESSWRDPGGDEWSAGGYSKPSRRWRRLTLWGPYGLDQVCIVSIERPAKAMGNHRYPGGVAGKFVVKGSDGEG